MNWTDKYSADMQPTKEQIADFIANPLWSKINSFLGDNYGIEPKYCYSACSGQPGWNVKYQKAGKSLCTLYPMEGFFIALVVVGAKEQTEAELMMPTFTGQVQDLMRSSGGIAGARWLMINVKDEQTLNDVKRLIQIRRKIEK
ncbi:DUF3788 domain-containing protein [Eubacteriales bacterium OttesenSCG-928-K08]|nr:DUF3788 domain-containing protein [Eubacteriales bacterium OttesenSCG-928-K08]